MFQAKYIVLKDEGFGLEKPIIFDPFISHADMARKFPGDKVVGAGFMQIIPDKETPTIKCFGVSDSLGISAREKDSALLTRIVCRQ